MIPIKKKKRRLRHFRYDKSGILPDFVLKVLFSSLLSMAENMGNKKKLFDFFTVQSFWKKLTECVLKNFY